MRNTFVTGRMGWGYGCEKGDEGRGGGLSRKLVKLNTNTQLSKNSHLIIRSLSSVLYRVISKHERGLDSELVCGCKALDNIS